MHKLNPDERALLEYIEETAPFLPVHKRIRIYRGLADLIEIKRHRTRLLKKVRILQEAERRCAELHFEPETDDGHDGHKS
jgi:hypothetical protein